MRKLGLDLGSSSIGWALREADKILQKGVITFQSGMVKGQGGYTSPTKDRREARSKRRLIQARKYRKWELLKILIKNDCVPIDNDELEIWSKYKKGQAQKFPENDNFLKWLACNFGYQNGNKEYQNPYQLRVAALDHILTKHEFGRCLYHLVQRRGYKDIGETDNETKKQIERRSEEGFENALKTNRTIAEALTHEFLNKNKRARNQYPLRPEYQGELEEICKGQGYDISKKNDGEYADAFVQSIWKAIIWQRPLRSQKGNIGKCTLEPTKPRCPISHPLFEVFRALSFINTIKYIDKNGKKELIPQEYRDQLFEQLFLKRDKNFKFEEIRKFLDKSFKEKKIYNYPFNERKGIYDTSVAGLPVCTGLVKLFGQPIADAISTIELNDIGNAPKIVHGYSLYDLWHALFTYENKFLEKFAIEKLGVANETAKNGKEYNPFERLKTSITSGYADLSIKAISKILPFLRDGYLYNEAVVLAKIPELLKGEWTSKAQTIKALLDKSTRLYEKHKNIIAITNNLIDKYKGLEYPDIFAYKDYQYILASSDILNIEKTSKNYFGEKTWETEADKANILDDVKKEYQAFFSDVARAYRKVPTLTDIFLNKLQESNIMLRGDLYHHSNKENSYGEPVKDKLTGKEILPESRIDSIKNPMFNKSMGILRKLVNELILNDIIDNDTEIVVEIARELNDNNKRIAIERYQAERRTNREKYREFLNEFKQKENGSINVDESIGRFELWSEQTFEHTENEKKEQISNKNTHDILREKEAVKRYELWSEQKGQCIYTGKMISITQLFSSEIDIEHTIPQSLLPDNTMANQTVCYARYNRDIKKNQIPFDTVNYNADWGGFTAILPRLESWIQTRDNYKELYEKRLKAFGNEDEASKNKRIQDKHYFKLHLEYWHDKIERFLAKEVKDGWVRRQLTDTQTISKYAREYLKTYFKKVAVQKGSITADFRKIYGFQEEDEIKSRNKHTHHAIDAAVLTLIPVNSSHRDQILKNWHEELEGGLRPKQLIPFKGFNSQDIIHDIENYTLIVNYENDKILAQTYKNVRKRGRVQYLKNNAGEFILDDNGNKTLLKSKGDTVRSTLFAATYIGKIRDVERDDDEQPMRENGDWKYKTGKDEFLFVKRENIDKVRTSDKLIDAIIDPVIKKMVRIQRNETVVKDHQGNIVRHVRIKTNTGREIKQRINYKSEYDYKNKFYAEAGSGSILYAILLQKDNGSEIQREMIPVAAFEIAKMHKKSACFDIDQYIKGSYPDFADYPGRKLLKVGQKVIVINNDKEYDKASNIDFQTKRLYVITQFSEGSIWLKHHLEAQSKDEIKDTISLIKDNVLRGYEIPLGIPEISENNSIQGSKERKIDYENRKYRFDTINTSFRLNKISEIVGLERTKEIKKELDKFKAISGSVDEGKVPLLKLSSKNWNFLYEGKDEDFEVSMLGILNFI